MFHETESLREQRSRVIIRAAVHIADAAAPVERRVRNLSARGACIDHGGDLRQNAIVHLDMGSLTKIEAKVMWLTDRLAGLRFARSVDLAAARQPRGAPPIVSGWFAEINNAYRR